MANVVYANVTPELRQEPTEELLEQLGPVMLEKICVLAGIPDADENGEFEVDGDVEYIELMDSTKKFMKKIK
jgi:predicted RNA-binding protein with PUA domain